MMRWLPALAFLSLAGCASPQTYSLGERGRPVGEPLFSFVVISDVHIGEGHASYSGQEDVNTARARDVVGRVNELASTRGVELVFITGDLTDSAETSELETCRDILSGLTVPWFPILGNHDVWPYHDDWEAPAPTGDASYAKVFKKQLAGLGIPSEAVENPEQDCNSLFQNFVVHHQGFAFVCLDWNSRGNALLTYKGALPGADLHDFKGGTFPWLESTLAALPPETRRIFLLQHHPFGAPSPIPDWLCAFTDGEKERVRCALLAAHPAERYGAVFAGHFHRSALVPAFEEWPDLVQVETAACKESATVTLVEVFEDGAFCIASQEGE